MEIDTINFGRADLSEGPGRSKIRDLADFGSELPEIPETTPSEIGNQLTVSSAKGSEKARETQQEHRLGPRSIGGVETKPPYLLGGVTL